MHNDPPGLVGQDGLDGALVELLPRDQKAVAPQGQGTVVLRRWLVTGVGAIGNWLGDVVAVSVSGSGF